MMRMMVMMMMMMMMMMMKEDGKKKNKKMKKKKKKKNPEPNQAWLRYFHRTGSDLDFLVSPCSFPHRDLQAM